uniref:SURP motif domain-containing protein n=1 Tax=Ditylenchus dipsaci TaxID=166011 RepID=A0A915CUH3_9BILA
MSHKKNFARSKNRYASKEDEKQSLSVFGYSCRLYEEPESSKSNPKSAEEPGGHNYLLSWNGDEDVKIDRYLAASAGTRLFGLVSDRVINGFSLFNVKIIQIHKYDCRLYLNSLDEFDRSKSGNNGTKHSMDEAEGMEEEMCEEERYLDMYVDMQKVEEEEQVQRSRRAEFAFNYDSAPIETSARPEESSSSEEEIEEKYEMPEGLKLPMGIDLPETMKHSTIIEKTAMFVVQQGPQMEVVIKAKQRNNIQQFGFLEFDDRLNPFYKYVCKLIREKKYTPVPYITKTRPKTKKLCRLAAQARMEESLKADAEAKQIDQKRSKPPSALEMIAHDNQSGSDASNDDSDEEGYLHPLLTSSSTKKVSQPESKSTSGTSRRSRLSDAPVIFGPMPQPVVKHVVQVKTAPNFDEILQQHHSNAQSNVDNIYSSLFKNLNSLLPGAKARAEEEELQKKKEEEEKAAKEIELEDDEEKIRDYIDWHMEFYGRPSPYLPSAHPVALPPPPNLSSALSIAARYVAMNGGAAEQKLIDHNGESCEFLFPKSPYYTYYQMRVRYNQWMMNQSYLAAAAAKQVSQQGAPISTQKDDQSDDIVFASTSSCIFPAPPRPPNGVNIENSIVPTELPLLMNSSSANTLDANDEPNIDNVEAALKMERKEKARLFMEKILNEKLAAKKRAQDGSQNQLLLSLN